MNRYLFLIFLFCPLLLNAASAKTDLKLGNKAYKQEKYGQAYEYYQKAALAGQEKALFNSGAALYNLQDYDGASKEFLQSAEVFLQKDPSFAQDSYYNAANAQYMNQQTKEALLSARKAILLNSKDEAAIHNMQFMLENHNKNNKDQQNKQGNKNAPQDKQDNQKEQQNQGSQDQDKQNQDQQDKQQNEQDKDKLSKEQAQDILKMLGDNEKKNTPPPLEGSSGKDKNSQSQVEKDW